MDKMCNYVIETAPVPFSKNFRAPLTPYLVGFETVPAEGNAWTLPTWYRLRMVQATLGLYLQLGKWTTSPVMAGASQLPCPPDGCPSSTCGAPPSDDEEGEIIGYLNGTYTAGNGSKYFACKDFFNPCYSSPCKTSTEFNKNCAS